MQQQQQNVNAWLRSADSVQADGYSRADMESERRSRYRKTSKNNLDSQNSPVAVVSAASRYYNTNSLGVGANQQHQNNMGSSKNSGAQFSDAGSDVSYVHVQRTSQAISAAAAATSPEVVETPEVGDVMEQLAREANINVQNEHLNTYLDNTNHLVEDYAAGQYNQQNNSGGAYPYRSTTTAGAYRSVSSGSSSQGNSMNNSSNESGGKSTVISMGGGHGMNQGTNHLLQRPPSWQHLSVGGPASFHASQSSFIQNQRLQPHSQHVSLVNPDTGNRVSYEQITLAMPMVSRTPSNVSNNNR